VISKQSHCTGFFFPGRAPAPAPARAYISFV